jgi:hypothetical protein
VKHKKILLALLAGWLAATVIPPQRVLGKISGGKRA